MFFFIVLAHALKSRLRNVIRESATKEVAENEEDRS